MQNSTCPTLACLGALILANVAATTDARAAERQAPLEFSGGHDIGKNDYGRPVVLMAAALGVKPDQFRRAFSGVTPARGRGPTGAEARNNKEALMKVLGPLGVTNDRMDAVADYYRFQPQRGELWKTTAAKGYAVIEDGKVKKIVVTQPGSGYSTPPKVAIQGHEKIELKAELHYDKDFAKNGAIESVAVVDKPGK